MRHCLRLSVFHGNKPATVCACFMLPGVFFKAHVFLSPFFLHVGAAGYRPHERQLVSASEGNVTVADGAVTPSA